MKKLTTIILLIFSVVYFYGQTPCQNGFAGSYPCNDYDLMSHIPLSTMNAGSGNDSWGWTDPQNGNEYAIIGLDNGTAFIDISNPTNPVYLGKLPSAVGSSSWRDVKVYKDHAFIVADFIGNHGMQVFDLTRLRNVANPPQTFTADTRYTGFGSAHNIVINEDSGYAYIVGTSRSGTYKGGPLFINIQDPKNPKDAGGFLSGGQRAYTHDAQVVTYNGPDTDYVGKEILIGSNEIEVVIADITNKANPVTISTIKYSDVRYTHQGWFTEDMRYFILGDELDEQGVGFNTKTIIFDFQDLDNPKFHFNYFGPTPSTDHNGYVKGNLFYLANYRAGLRVIDISNIATKTMTEVGFFDTYTSSNSVTLDGVWNVYPYFNSGNIVISDIQGGFFLVRKSGGGGSCVASVPTGLSSSGITATAATINWTAVSNASYDVRYRQTGSTNWSTVTSGTNSYTINGLSPNTSYQAQVRSKCPDGTSSNYSTSVSFTTTNVQISYCASNGNNVSDEYISNVSLGTINNTSGASSGGYDDNTSISTNLAKGEQHTISITPTWTGTTYSEGYSVWIDFNNDGDFLDSGEQVWSQNATRTTPVSGTFSIPSNAAIGSTRMRVSMKYNAIPTSCESFQYGEVEDYTVSIIEGGSGGGTTCVGGVSSFPYNESFENTLGQWTQSPADDLDWTIDASGTPSRSTGPSSANQGTYYIYVEASGNGTGFPNKRAIVTSSCFDLSGVTSATFSFAYHMYGTGNMGSIAVEASIDDGTTWTSIWNQNQNQGNTWNNVNLDISSYAGESLTLRFNRVTGNTWQADVAIDNVSLTTNAVANASLIPEDSAVFAIYPNPVYDSTLNVSIANKSLLQFEIKNFVGQTVSKGNLANTIDVSYLRSGVYFLQISTPDGIVTKRFVKK